MPYRTMTEAVYDYHKKRGIEYRHKEYTHTFDDGSEQVFNIESEEKEVELKPDHGNMTVPVEDRREVYTAWVMTKRLVIREWLHEEQTFRTPGMAIKYIQQELTRMLKGDV